MTGNILKSFYWTLSFVLLCFASCKKTDINSYPKDAIKLTINATILEWEKVSTSDFIEYEVFASNKEQIDILDESKVVKTFKDFEVTKFDIGELFIDSLEAGGKIYVKVAAVLKNRKIASNTAIAQSSTLFSASNFSLVGAIPETGKIVLLDNTTFNQFSVFDINTNSFEGLPNGLIINTSSNLLNYGKNANGQYRIIQFSGSTIDIVNLETKSFDHQYNPNNSSILSYALVNGFILLNIYNSSLGNYVMEVRRESDFTLVNTFMLMNSTANFFYPSSDNTKFLASNSFGNSEMYSISNTGAVSLLGNGTLVNTNGNLISINTDGSKICVGSQGVIYGSNLSQLSILNSSFLLTSVAFSNSGSQLAVLENSNKIRIFDATTFQSIKEYTIGGANVQFFSTKLYYMNNSLYVISQVFDGVSNSKFVILKK